MTAPPSYVAAEAVAEALSVDPTRQYLTGLSMGGYGTWSTHPPAWRGTRNLWGQKKREILKESSDDCCGWAAACVPSAGPAPAGPGRHTRPTASPPSPRSARALRGTLATHGPATARARSFLIGSGAPRQVCGGWRDDDLAGVAKQLAHLPHYVTHGAVRPAAAPAAPPPPHRRGCCCRCRCCCRTAAAAAAAATWQAC